MPTPVSAKPASDQRTNGCVPSVCMLADMPGAHLVVVLEATHAARPSASWLGILTQCCAGGPQDSPWTADHTKWKCAQGHSYLSSSISRRGEAKQVELLISIHPLSLHGSTTPCKDSHWPTFIHIKHDAWTTRGSRVCVRVQNGIKPKPKRKGLSVLGVRAPLHSAARRLTTLQPLQTHD